jgi:hypothetical protein
MSAQFTRLVRFEDSNGNIHYGEAGSDWRKDLIGQTIPTYSISSVFEEDFPLTGSKVEVAKVWIITKMAQDAGYGANIKAGSLPTYLSPDHHRHRAELQSPR